MNISNKLKYKFYFKYITLFFLCILYVPLFGIIITQFIRKDLFVMTLIFFCVDLVISLVLTVIYYNFFSLPSIEDIDTLMTYLDFFKSDTADLLYTEAITWFSSLIKDEYIKSNESKSDELNNYINNLYLILRPNSKGLCEAIKHKSAFALLCAKIKNQENITEDILGFKNLPCEKYNYINFIHDKNFVIYILFLPLHTFACFLITRGSDSSFDKYTFWGNFFLYIPTDVLAILIYKGYLKNTQS